MASAIAGTNETTRKIVQPDRQLNAVSGGSIVSPATPPAIGDETQYEGHGSATKALAKSIFDSVELIPETPIARDNELVANDARRKNLPSDQQWVFGKTGLTLKIGVETEVAPALSLGFEAKAKFQVRTLLAKPLGPNPHVSGDDLFFPRDGRRFLTEPPAPGSLWRYKGREAVAGSATFGIGESVSAGPLKISGSAGISAEVEAAHNWRKEVVAMGDGKVFIVVANEHELARTLSIGAEGNIGFDTDVGPAVADEAADIALGRLVRKFNKSDLIASVSKINSSEGIGAAVYDLKNPAELEAYHKVLYGLPSLIVKDVQERGRSYEGKKKIRESDFHFRILEQNLDTHTRTLTHEIGTLNADGKSTHVEEMGFVNKADGAIRDWLGFGQSYDNSFKIGEMREGESGVTERAGFQSLNLHDNASNGAYINKWLNFGRIMGFKEDELPAHVDPKREFGASTFSLLLAVPESGLNRVKHMTEPRYLELLRDAAKRIEGGNSVPAYFNDAALSEVYNANDLDKVEGGKMKDRFYRTHGVDYDEAMETRRRFQNIWHGIEKVQKSGELKDWDDLVKSVGNLPAEELRIVATILREKAGAQIVRMHGKSGNVEVNFAAEAKAPESIEELLAALLSAPSPEEQLQ